MEDACALTLEIPESVGEPKHDGRLCTVIIDRRTLELFQYRSDGILRGPLVGLDPSAWSICARKKRQTYKDRDLSHEDTESTIDLGPRDRDGLGLERRLEHLVSLEISLERLNIGHCPVSFIIAS